MDKERDRLNTLLEVFRKTSYNPDDDDDIQIMADIVIQEEECINKIRELLNVTVVTLDEVKTVLKKKL